MSPLIVAAKRILFLLIRNMDDLNLNLVIHFDS